MIQEPMKTSMQISLMTGEKRLDQLRFCSTSRNRAVICCTVLFCILALLTACNTAAGYPSYEVIYSSNLSIPSTVDFNKPRPVAESDLLIFSKYSDKSGSILHILDTDGTIFLSFENVATKVGRGMVDENLLWLTVENWGKGNFGVYTDSALISSQIITVDLNTNETILNKKMKNDDLFLFVKDGYCYFYDRGKAPGKWIDNSVKANIYYRHIDKWDEAVQVHQFDYTGKPADADTLHTLQFQLQADGFSVSLDLRDLNDQREWTNRTVWSVDVPFVISE